MGRRRGKSRKNTDTKMAKIIYPRDTGRGVGFSEELIPLDQADERIKELKKEVYE